MMGYFLSRVLVMVFGYAYPAYKCFKILEKSKPEIDHLIFWCQYWILVALLTLSERVGDTFISWLPLYDEAKLAFFIYLWHPRTNGTLYVYNSFIRPYVAKHEKEIDGNLLDMKNKAWNIAASYGQTIFYEVLQCASSFSARTLQPVQLGQRLQYAGDGQPPVSIPANKISPSVQHHQNSRDGQPPVSIPANKTFSGKKRYSMRLREMFFR